MIHLFWIYKMDMPINVCVQSMSVFPLRNFVRRLVLEKMYLITLCLIECLPKNILTFL